MAPHTQLWLQRTDPHFAAAFDDQCHPQDTLRQGELQMGSTSRTVVLSAPDTELVKRLHDPYSDHLYHLEAILPFSEVAKLDRGNANVRPPDKKKPAYKAM